jgi:hypothetical protein
MWASTGGVRASSQCGEERKYSSDRDGRTSSIRNGTIGSPLFTALSTSRRICGDAFALDENTSTITRARWIDLQIGTLSNDRPGAATLLHYLRYDIPLLRKSLIGVGLEYEEKRVQELWEMSDVRNLADLEKIGAASAAAAVQDQHFRAVSDRKPTPASAV